MRLPCDRARGVFVPALVDSAAAIPQSAQIWVFLQTVIQSRAGIGEAIARTNAPPARIRASCQSAILSSRNTIKLGSAPLGFAASLERDSCARSQGNSAKQQRATLVLSPPPAPRSTSARREAGPSSGCSPLGWEPGLGPVEQARVPMHLRRKEPDPARLVAGDCRSDSLHETCIWPAAPRPLSRTRSLRQICGSGRERFTWPPVSAMPCTFVAFTGLLPEATRAAPRRTSPRGPRRKRASHPSQGSLATRRERPLLMPLAPSRLACLALLGTAPVRRCSVRFA